MRVLCIWCHSALQGSASRLDTYDHWHDQGQGEIPQGSAQGDCPIQTTLHRH